jgi:hypothetical protein
MKSTIPSTKVASKTLDKVVARKPAAKKAAAKAPLKAVVAPKPAVKTAAKIAPSTQPVTAKIAAKTPAKAANPIIRDSFTMTTADQELLKKCKRNAITAGRDSTKKSEIIRAALRHFAALSPSTQLMEINGLDTVKTGRPKKK